MYYFKFINLLNMFEHLEHAPWFEHPAQSMFEHAWNIRGTADARLAVIPSAKSAPPHSITNACQDRHERVSIGIYEYMTI